MTRPRNARAFGVSSLFAGLLPLIACSADPDEARPVAVATSAPASAPSPSTPATSVSPISPATLSPTPVPTPSPKSPTAAPKLAALPGGGNQVFNGRFLVAYYGTATTDTMGVLGEQPPEQIIKRLRAAARPFAARGRRVQPVFELIVSVAQGAPGRDGDYSADLPRAEVQRYLDAAERYGVLVVLDIQPGRSDFLTVSKRWEWALRHPWVGLALDPEWRMGRNQAPGKVIGSVDAAEVNAVSAWLSALTTKHALPQKVFVLHQFRTSMIRRIGRVQSRPGLAMVQHIDGFGTPGEKLATYRAVARPKQFRMGWKLFYDEDRPRMTPRQVLRIDPTVDFVSYQ